MKSKYVTSSVAMSSLTKSFHKEIKKKKCGTIASNSGHINTIIPMKI